MLFLFRERPDSDPQKPIPRVPPFYLNRRLTQQEWQACARSYAAFQVRRLLFAKSQEARLGSPSQKNTKPERKKNNPEIELGWGLFFLLGRWDLPGFPLKDQWKIDKVLGQFLFANSQETHQAARKQLKRLAERGKPVQLRPIISQIALTPFRVKNRFPLIRQNIKTPNGAIKEIPSIEDMVRYLAKRQFLWAFLRKEAGSLQKSKEAERKGIADKFSPKLAEFYPFLKMNAETIAKGLVNSRQADQDTAEKFQCSPTAIRSLLSKSLKF